MLGKRLRPPAPEPIVVGEWAGFREAAATTPKSPNRWSQEMEGIGLGIVAALGKSCQPHSKVVLGSPKLGRPGPISVACARNPKVKAGGGVCEMGVDWTDSESYTCVTCRGPHVQSPVTTRVYYDETEISPRRKFELPSTNIKEEKSRNFGGVFWASPPRVTGDSFGFPTSDFLSYCYLCRKKLHGEDIYMYRGEKAFCSVECRYQQIISDEYQETCGSEVSRASDVAVSAYAHGRIFLPGIVAA